MPAEPDIPSTPDPPQGGNVIPFTPDNEQAVQPDEEQQGPRAYSTLRAPTFAEHTGMVWEQVTHGLFSSGPKAAPRPEGIKTEFKDIPSIWGGMATETLLNPGNILSGAFTAGLGPAAKNIVGKAFGAYMAGSAAKSTPGLYKELADPDTSAAQKVVDVGAMAAQAGLGAYALKNPIITPAQRAVFEYGQALGAMDPKDATKLFKSTNAASPTEVAQALSEEAAKSKDVETGAKLISASRRFQDLANYEPKEVRQLSEGQKAMTELKRFLAPATLGKDAAKTAGSMREMGGDLAQRTDRAEAALSASSKLLMKLPADQRWAAVEDIESGRNTKNPDLQQFADTAREIMDSKRDEIRALGTGKLEHFIEDYFPHIWKDPEAAATAFQKASARAPMEGSKSFLKQRTVPTIAEGMAMGLEPVSTNPVDLLLLKAREMDKYITAQKWMAEMKDKDLVKFVRSGEEAPQGYEPINDRIAKVYGPRQGGVTFAPDVNTLTVQPSDVTVHGQRIMGQYHAPGEVAAVANNYLSPGLRKFASFRAYLGLTNVLNRFQLGLSAFHLGFTSVDTSISKVALALEYAGQGKLVKAAGKLAQAPSAPITNLFEGDRVMSEWLRPGTQGAEMAKVVDAIRKAGGRAKMDTLYQTTITKNMMNLWRDGKKGSAIWRAPFAAMEQVTKPLMEYVVPRQKLGVASEMMRMEMDRMPANATEDEMRARFAKVWDSVDNRMGQMVYDNLFWNRAVKDLSMATVRSVGWDLGTIRELGGGMVDTAKFAKGAVTPGESAKFTHRMAYTISLPLVTGFLGATYQYLHTGEGPQELRDYFFPKTGEKDPQGRDVRMNLPTYMKDVYHYGHDFWGTVTGKVSPAPAAVIEMLNNKDFFGRPIRNSDDPLVVQMKAEAEYFAKLWEPIGVRQFDQASDAGQTKGERAAAFLGVTRSPAWVGESSAEQLAGKLAGDKFKESGSPDTAKVLEKQQIQKALRDGTQEEKDTAALKLDAMVDSGEMSPAQRRNLEKGTEHTYLENAVSHLDANEAMRVYALASPAEREAIYDAVERKVDHVHLPESDKQDLRERFQKLSSGLPETEDLKTPYE